jgi:hypothetical protein
MPHAARRITWAALTGALLGVAIVGNARGDRGLEAEFEASLRAGEPATLAITWDYDVCCPIQCSWYSGFAEGIGCSSFPGRSGSLQGGLGRVA